MEIDPGYSPNPRPADTDQGLLDNPFRGSHGHAPKRRGTTAKADALLVELRQDVDHLLAFMGGKCDLNAWQYPLEDYLLKM